MHLKSPLPSFWANSPTYFYWLPLNLEVILRKTDLYVKLPLSFLAKYYKFLQKFLHAFY